MRNLRIPSVARVSELLSASWMSGGTVRRQRKGLVLVGLYMRPFLGQGVRAALSVLDDGRYCEEKDKVHDS